MTHENIEIPNTLPAMTLRGVVLFPSAMMPLRIFEPRYREMLNDVLSQDRMFAIVREREMFRLRRLNWNCLIPLQLLAW